jgi:hypothetical protein
MSTKNVSLIKFTVGVLTVAALSSLLGPLAARAEDHQVYSIYRPVDMGDGTANPKDIFVNMGSANGVRIGTQLEVLRKLATYDLQSQKLYKDVIIPVAKLKVIHVENNAAIARLEKMAPPEVTPNLETRAVLVGDFVRMSH